MSRGEVDCAAVVAPFPSEFDCDTLAAPFSSDFSASDYAKAADAIVDSASYHIIQLKDGGGMTSTVDWQLPPASALSDPLQKVRQCLWKCMPADSFLRLRSRATTSSAEPLFSTEEVHRMRQEICVALQIDPNWALQPFELTPYFFNLLSTIAHCMGDVDATLCETLKCGAPTGVRQRIPASGVWPPLHEDGSEPCEEPLQLQVSEGNHASALAEPERLLALIDKEIESGYMREVPGGLIGLQQQFGADLAVGKLGIIMREGKDDRLIGDSRASLASPAAKFSERMEVPSLYHFGAALSRLQSKPSDWCLMSLDIRGAHKTIRTDPADIGFSAFMFQDRAFVYLVNHFGASWSAYWWSRLSAMLIRMVHFLLRHKHIAGVYIDDFLLLLPRDSAIQLGSLVIAFLQVLNVPLSWKKLQLGQQLEYLGWSLHFDTGFCATITETKLQRLFKHINWWLLHPRRVCREELQQFLGLAIWATQVHLLLRPFLAPLFRALHARAIKIQSLCLQQLEELAQITDAQLEVIQDARLSDVRCGWRVVSVGKASCKDASALRQFLEQPKITNNRVWVRFSAWGRTTDLRALQTAALRQLSICWQNPLFLCCNPKFCQMVLQTPGPTPTWQD